jgi:aminoglycoside phosphotransferase family enzyme
MSGPTTSAPGLEEKVAFLRRPESYPEPTQDVEVVETHMHWVFLTDHRVYKLKKPVRYEFLDFSTPEARREDCLAEVRLNRRLAPDVYLGVTALRTDEEGLRLDGEGRAVDWLTRMKRLPRESMLDRAIERGEVDERRLREAGRKLARFYRDADPVRLSPGGHLSRLRRYVRENRRELTRPEHGLDEPETDEVGRGLEAFLTEREEVVARRAEEGRIVEGHGDLRPEHVCLRPDPVIIDCIEFNREFRLVDPADELAFLAMECGIAGAGWAGEAVLEEYRCVTGDVPPPELLGFYASHRALLRAKLSIWHIRDASVTDHQRWRERARTYLAAAAAHLPG